MATLHLGTEDYATDGTNGKVGIGTTSPDQGLHVVDAGAVTSKFESNNATHAMVEFENTDGDDAFVGVSSDGLSLSGESHNSDHVIIKSDGNVGIGTTNPGAKLDIEGSNHADALKITNSDGTPVELFAVEDAVDSGNDATVFRSIAPSTDFTGIIAVTPQDNTSAAIQEAIDYLDSKGGGIVYLPSGTYLMTSTVTVKEKIQVVGTNGTILEVDSSDPIDVFDVEDDAGSIINVKQGISFKHLRFTTKNTSDEYKHRAINLNNSHMGLVEQVQVEKYLVGIVVEKFVNTLLDCNFDWNGIGIQLNGMPSVKKVNITSVSGSGPYTIQLASGTDLSDLFPGLDLWDEFAEISDTATGGSTTSLIDTSKNFSTLGVAINDWVYNQTTGCRGRVTSMTTTTNSNDTLNFTSLSYGSRQNFQNNDSYFIPRRRYLITDVDDGTDQLTVADGYSYNTAPTSSASTNVAEIAYPFLIGQANATAIVGCRAAHSKHYGIYITGQQNMVMGSTIENQDDGSVGIGIKISGDNAFGQYEQSRFNSIMNCYNEDNIIGIEIGSNGNKVIGNLIGGNTTPIQFESGYSDVGNTILGNTYNSSGSITYDDLQRIPGELVVGEKIGIGTTSPAQGLHVKDEGAITIKLESSNATNAMIEFENQNGVDAFVGVSTNGLSLSGNNYDSDHVIVDSEGNVGIGTTNPHYNLTVDGVLAGLERSSDPAEPNEGEFIIWMSDGTGKGDDGDVLIASKADGTTRWGAIFNHSTGEAWS